jgi:hypothetical protein
MDAKFHPAIKAIKSDDLETVKSLVADKTIKDTKTGPPPSNWADYGGHPEIRDLLKG